ncbi:MAG: RIP metalloprotease RseP [Verrucomicrobiota bacterium]
MSTVSSILQVILLIFVVVMGFNLIIFVHELGHFLAAKWRGLQIDRFQIWFGAPIWKKTIGGVQYGLGWIPAGGFVALPQMAPMEALEGGSQGGKPLPAITPLDKIIVAFAGPLFSMLLALVSAVFVWQIGKPADFIPTTQVGFLVPDSPAQKAGLQIGDKIIAINGAKVNGFAGSLESISENIVLSRGKEIRYTVQRDGVAEPITLTSGFETEETRWFQRGGLRQVGIMPAGSAIVGSVMANSPAADAGITKGDKILTVDGIKLHSLQQLSQYLRDQKWKTVELGLQTADGGTREVELTPERPVKPAGTDPMVGIQWADAGEVDTRIVHPGPVRQVTDSLKMMWTTITSVIAPDSSIGVGHLSGPVGIAKLQYQLLQTDDGWRRILAFMVLFNVNLAVLNMMPFPVLDGGHIVLAILEKLFGRPVKAKPLEILQTACALALISLMLFVTSKDIGDSFGHAKEKNEEVVFPAN